jgi:2,3-bisphosphoglycerate-independent phosphoglycerate mutase
MFKKLFKIFKRKKPKANVQKPVATILATQSTTNQNPSQAPVEATIPVQNITSPVQLNDQADAKTTTKESNEAEHVEYQSLSGKIEIEAKKKETKLDKPTISKTNFNQQYPKREYLNPPLTLLVLDGWGIGPESAGNAVTKAKTPNLDNLWMSFPHTQLSASGVSVGLPQGADGNTETGHLNIGAGTIVYQELARIDNSIKDKTFAQASAFTNAFNHVKTNNSNLHIMGLISQGTVHSNLVHLYELLDMCKQQHIPNVYIHAFTDGRDSPPTSSIKVIKDIQNKCHKLHLGKIATVMGRYWAMDRDKKWDRIEKAYDCLTTGAGQCIADPIAYIEESHKNKILDEFIEPVNICNDDGQPILIQNNDAVIFSNFRVDRPRELSRAFVMPDFEQGITTEDYNPHIEEQYKTSLAVVKGGKAFQRKKILENLYFVTMTTYEDILPVDVAFPMQEMHNNLGMTLAERGIRQLRVTETEKERFITTYLNGQEKKPYPGEEWCIFPSKGVKSYDQLPIMSAIEITNTITNSLANSSHDCIIANICNGDMVGHTGNLEAAIKACEVVDNAVGKIVNNALVKNGTVIVTADHGNVEEVINNESGEIDTEHSIYPVPFMIINNQFRGQPMMLPTGILADIVPTMLNLMGISKPDGMTGRNLFNLKLK